MSKPTQRFGSLLDYTQSYGSLVLVSAITGEDHTPYALSPKTIARMRCVDCGVNVVEVGDCTWSITTCGSVNWA